MAGQGAIERRRALHACRITTPPCPDTSDLISAPFDSSTSGRQTVLRSLEKPNCRWMSKRRLVMNHGT